MITSDLEKLVSALQKEKNLSRDTVIEVIESAVVAAARRRYGEERDIESVYNEELGEVELIYYLLLGNCWKRCWESCWERCWDMLGKLLGQLKTRYLRSL